MYYDERYQFMVNLVQNIALVCWIEQQFKLEVYQINKPPMYNAITLARGHISFHADIQNSEDSNARGVAGLNLFCSLLLVEPLPGFNLKWWVGILRLPQQGNDLSICFLDLCTACFTV